LPAEWNEDDPRDLPVIQDNLRRILLQVLRDAPNRTIPSVAMAQDWHRAIYRGARIPVPYFAGEIRDTDPEYPELIGYEVLVGSHPGVPSRDVPEELARFEEAMQEAVARLDSVLPLGARPGAELLSVLTLCALAHGEWVRIHPFANGNGRTARLWANWCAARYSLPAFVQLKPRPASLGYAIAAARSMSGDHSTMITEMAAMLERRLRGS
jgi:Fic family protein